jgi:hypothetical protein
VARLSSKSPGLERLYKANHLRKASLTAETAWEERESGLQMETEYPKEKKKKSRETGKSFVKVARIVFLELDHCDEKRKRRRSHKYCRIGG